MVKNYTAVIEQDEDGIYVGRVPELRGCVTQGDTIDELIENLEDATSLCLDLRGDFIEDLREIEEREGVQFESKEELEKYLESL